MSDIVTSAVPPAPAQAPMGVPPTRVKDQKKVAAGLRLAQKNREAREALAREHAREALEPEPT